MPRSEAIERAKLAHQTIRALLEQLEYFAAATSADRLVLKRLIPGPDAGYVSSLLASLYNE